MLAKDGIGARVVSMPCWDLFEEQDETYRDAVLGTGTVKVAIEAGVRAWAGTAISAQTARFIGMHGFGASAPVKDRLQAFRHHRRSRGGRGARRARRQALGVRSWPFASQSTASAASGGWCCGRSWNRAASDIVVVGVNDLGPVETNAHLLRYDSVHGRFPGEVTVDGDHMIVGGHKIKVTAIKNPAELPHKELGVDIALECTGIFTVEGKSGGASDRRRQARAGLRARRRRRHDRRLWRQPRQADQGRIWSSPTPPAPPTAWCRWPRCCTTRSASSTA